MKNNFKPKRTAIALSMVLLVASLSSCTLLSSTSDAPISTVSAFSVTEPPPTAITTPEPTPAVTTIAPTTATTTEPPSTTAEPDPPPPPEPTVNKLSFLAAGDNLIHSYIYKYAKDSSETDCYNFLPIYGVIADRIAEADLSYINQETMMDDSQYYSGYPRFNTPEAMASDLAALGFDIAGIGNNHTLDRGTDTVINTIDKLNEAGLTTIGAYKDAKDAANVRVVTQNGIRIALLSYTYGTNEGYNGKKTVHVPIIDDDRMIADLEKASGIADFTMVFVHWGKENRYQYSAEQARVAKVLAENGAGVIIGTHPHVLQSVEWIDDGKGGRVLCAYSLGNLISTMANDYNMMGGLLTFDIVMTEGDERAHIENPLLTPTAFYYNGRYNEMSLMYLQDFTDEMEQNHGVLLVHGDKIDNDVLVEKYKQYIANEFRIEMYQD